MNILIKIRIVLVLSCLPHVLFAQEVLLKINPVECVSCISLVNQLMDEPYNARIVFDRSFQSDSIDVYDRFDFYPYQGRITWSDSLYFALSSLVTSEVVIYNKGKIVDRQAFKQFDFSRFKARLKGVGYVDTITVPGLSNNINFSSGSNVLLIQNYMSNKYGLYNRYDQSLIPILDDPDTLAELLYLTIFRDTISYLTYREAGKRGWHVTIEEAYMEADSLVKFMLCIPGIAKVDGHDTFLQRHCAIAVVEGNRIVRIHPIFSSGLPEGYHFANGSFLNPGDTLYTWVILDQRQPGLSLKDYKYAARFVLKEGVYIFDKLYDYTYDSSAVRFDIQHKFFDYIYDNEYYTLSISDQIINLEKEEQITIPYPRAYFELNRNSVPEMRLGFANVDIKYKPENGEFVVLYRMNAKYYAGVFIPGKRDFKEVIEVFDAAALDGKWHGGICLTDDGKGLIYSHNKQIITKMF